MSHKKAHKAQKLIVRFSVFFVLFCGATLQGQQVLHVYLTFDTPDFNLWLAKDSQTVAMLEPKSAAGFNFTPGDRLCRISIRKGSRRWRFTHSRQR